MNSSVESLSITHVTENERPKFICLHFLIENVPLYIFVKKPSSENGLFIPTKVIHNSDLPCPCCQKRNGLFTTCEPLQLIKMTLFHHIIAFNHIRLNWLYREYPEKEESIV